MDLFSASPASGEPLAYRMRPRTLEEFLGQEHIVGPGRLLRRVIAADQLSSVIFSGPPGTGKTTLARVIANTTKSSFISINAVLSGVKDLRVALEEARNNRELYGRRTILFVDEVHRWNKAQQDALLPWVENGTVILIGATTENPFFEVNPALVSRSRIFQLKPLTREDLKAIAQAALRDKERGYGNYKVILDEEALEHLINVSDGDARSLLNALELAVETTPERFPPPPEKEIRINLEIAEQSIQKKAVLYDKEGDYHFDTISAFIKSLRGSDPDASLYWLARMVHAGEDPRFIFRRMLILACEDVGLADPFALGVVEAAAAAFERVGLPEGRFHLTHAALYLANAPKSNSALGFFDALSAVEEEFAKEVPSHLKDSSRDKMGFGHGEGYLYPHSFRDHWIAQQYLPTGLQGRVFYTPSNLGWEAGIASSLEKRRELQIEASLQEAPAEILTFSPRNRGKEEWLNRINEETVKTLTFIRDRIFQGLQILRHFRILDLKAGSGFLIWEALRRVPEGGVWGLAEDKEKELIDHHSSFLEETERPLILTCTLEDLPSLQKGLSGDTPFKELHFDLIVGRNILTQRENRRSVFSILSELLEKGGLLSLAEIYPRKGQRLSQLEETALLAPPARRALEETEEKIYSSPAFPPASLTKELIADLCHTSGLSLLSLEEEVFTEKRRITLREIEAWFGENSGGTFARILQESASQEIHEALLLWAKEKLIDRILPWNTSYLFLKAENPR